jgi:deferrochelatase/peroxidase EfeB
MSPALPLTESPAADEIQGNVLAPFNKPHMHFLMVRLPEQGDRARGWLAEMAGLVASSGKVARHNALQPRPHAT